MVALGSPLLWFNVLRRAHNPGVRVVRVQQVHVHGLKAAAGGGGGDNDVGSIQLGKVEVNLKHADRATGYVP
jgi:alpha-D-ribose 1-methylphosphonate 5-triphosphate synthase subunit PhnG